MATTLRALGKCRVLMNAAAKSTVSATAKTTKKVSTTAAAATGDKPLRGILKPMPISPVLQDFIGGGSDKASRTEAVKKVWEYIKANNLQNPADKKQIICDEKLKILFSGKDTVDFLEVARLLSQHFVKAA